MKYRSGSMNKQEAHLLKQEIDQALSVDSHIASYTQHNVNKRDEEIFNIGIPYGIQGSYGVTQYCTVVSSEEEWKAFKTAIEQWAVFLGYSRQEEEYVPTTSSGN